jgi:hypothetical protein
LKKFSDKIKKIFKEKKIIKMKILKEKHQKNFKIKLKFDKTIRTN